MMISKQISTGPTLTLRRAFAAPRERVFAAWTDAALVRQWIAPNSRVIDAHWQAHEGGTLRVAITVPGAEEFVAKGSRSPTYEHRERLAFTFRWEEDERALEHETFITVELLDRGNETEMIFTQEGLRNEGSRHAHSDGWTEAFDKLAQLNSA